MGGLYKLVYNKYFVDEIYDAAVITPTVEGSRTVLWKGVDAGLIDGTVNGVGSAASAVGGVLRRMQSGNLRSYATWVLAGSSIDAPAAISASTRRPRSNREVSASSAMVLTPSASAASPAWTAATARPASRNRATTSVR
jgi:hypothetical protein